MSKRRLRERVADLEARNATLLRQLEESRSEGESWRWTAQDRLRRLSNLQDSYTSLTRMSRVLVSSARGDTVRYRLAWQSARRRANLHKTTRIRLDRALRACARYRAELAQQQRVNDHLSDQLMGAMGYPDAALTALGVRTDPPGEWNDQVKRYVLADAPEYTD